MTPTVIKELVIWFLSLAFGLVVLLETMGILDILPDVFEAGKGR